MLEVARALFEQSDDECVGLVGIVDLVGAGHFFFEVHQATEAAEAEAPLSPDPDLQPSSPGV